MTKPWDYFRGAAPKSRQSCLTPWDPIEGSPPGSFVPGILQARTLKWVAISFSNAWKWKEKVKSLSRVRLLATPWTAAHQAPPSMGFSRQVYWSGVEPLNFVSFKHQISKFLSDFNSGAHSSCQKLPQEPKFLSGFASGAPSFCRILPQEPLVFARFYSKIP